MAGGESLPGMPYPSQQPHRLTARRLAALAGALAAAGGMALAPEVIGAPGVAEMPDLVADLPVNLMTKQQSVQGRVGTRLLLRFDGHVHNAGTGPLEIQADVPTGSWADDTLRMSYVRQVFYDSNGDYVDDEPSSVDFMHAGPSAPAAHQHWHTDRASAFHLVSASSHARIKESDKVGFCLSDSQPVEAGEGAPQFYQPGGCKGEILGTPITDPALTVNADHVKMGISAGWRDTYAAYYYTQWVDLTGEISPGRYQIEAIADPTDVIIEADEVNPSEFSAEVRLRGWLALPQSAATTAGAPAQIPLSADKVVGTGLPVDDQLSGEPAAPVYAIVTPPSHGTVTLSGATATYTPAGGYTGPDSFTFTASETGTLLAGPAATVSLSVSPAFAPRPAPSSPPAVAPRPVPNRTLAGVLRLRGRLATASFVARGKGRVTVSLRYRTRLVKRCVVAVRAGGRATCRARLPRGASAKRLTATATQVRAGRVVARARIAGAQLAHPRSTNR
jgi:hypothetical protein